MKVMTLAKPIVWTLDQALVFVRMWQKDTRRYGYHLCLGGGVLNAGASRKDLDLYFIPLDNTCDMPADYDGMLMELEAVLGPSQRIGGGDDDNYPEVPSSAYHAKRKFENNGQRIDAFFLKGLQ